jgi:hypothetical protein
MLRPPLGVSLRFSSAFFSGPERMQLQDDKARRGGGGGGGGGKAGSKTGSATGSPRPDGKSTNPPAGADDGKSNTMLVRFVPKQPGNYTGELMLASALDVRVYELAGTATAQGLKATLEFESQARQPHPNPNPDPDPNPNPNPKPKPKPKPYPNLYPSPNP